MRRQLFGDDNNAGEIEGSWGNRMQQEKRRMEYEMDGLRKRSHGHESVRAAQGCGGQVIVDLTHS